jgi:hypothetical protein
VDLLQEVCDLCLEQRVVDISGRVHAWHVRRRIGACHVRRRIHACHVRRRILALSNGLISAWRLPPILALHLKTASESRVICPS